MANITADTRLTRTTGAVGDFNFNTYATNPGGVVTNTARIWIPPAVGGTAGDLRITTNNVTFTANDCVIAIAGTSSGISTNGASFPNSLFDIRRVILDVNDANGFLRTNCNVTMEDVSFHQDGGVYNWGNWGGAATTFTLNNVRFYGYNMFPNFSNADTDSVFNNLSFYNGDADDPMGAFLEAGQQQAYPNAVFGPTTRARSNFGGGTGVAILRVNNEGNRGGGTSAGWSPYAQIDLRATTLVGDAGAGNANRICISVDRDVGLWLINPIFPDFTGIDNSIQLVGTSGTDVDAQGDPNRRPTNNNPATISVLQGWNPRIIQTGTTDVIQDAKIRFDQNHFVVPDTYAYTSPPFQDAAGVREASDVRTDNGYLFSNQFANFDSPTATAYNNPVAAPNQELNVTIPNRTGRFYSLTHGVGDQIGREWTLTYPTAGQALTDDVDTFSAFTATGITWDSTSDYAFDVDTYYALGTNQAAGVDNLDNFYTTLKTSFYTDEGDFIGIGAHGEGDNTIVFTRAISLNPNGTTRVQSTSNVLRTASAVALGNSIHTLEWRGASANATLTNSTWPTGITFRTTGNALLDFGGTAAVLSAGTTLDGRFSGIGSTHIETGQTVVEGSDLDIHFAATSFDIADIEITGTGTVTLRKSIGDAITIRVPNGMGSRFTAGTGVTVQELPPAQFARTITTPQQSGTFGVRNVTSNAVVVPAERTSTSTAGTYTIPAGDTDTYRFYWKQDNTPFVNALNPGNGYFTTIIERSNAGLTANTEETMEATEIFSLLYSGDAGIGRTNAVSDAAPGSSANSNGGFQIGVNNPDTNVATTAGASQYQILSAMDTIRYMQTMLDRGLTVDIISPPSSGSVTMNARFVQLNTATAGQQQRLVGAEFDNLQNNNPEDLTRSIFNVRSSTTSTAPTDAAYWELQSQDGQVRLAGESWGPTGNLPVNTTDVLVLYEPTGQETDLGREIRARVAAREASGNLLGVGGSININNSSGTNIASYNFSRATVVSDTEIRLQLSQLTERVLGIPTDNSVGTLDGRTLTGAQTDQIVQLTGTVTGGGSLSVNSVNILPNPAGATPTQIQDAATAAITNTGVVTAASAAETAANIAATQAEAAATAATSNLTVSMDSQNAVGYILGTDGDTRLLGIKPRSGNYNANTNYRGNVTGE